MPSTIALSRGIGGAHLRLPRFGGPSGVLVILLGLTLVRGILYAVLNPPFASPDEMDHFQYVAYLATNGASGPIGLEGHQPALYYALMVPAYWITAGQPAAVQLLAIRLASVSFLLGTVLFTWLAARRMAPGSTFVPVVATAFVALEPQFAYIGASASNDASANLAGAVLTYLVVSLLKAQPGRWVLPATAVTVGVAIFTKSQVLPIVAVSGVVLAGCVVARVRASGRVRPLLYVIVPALFAAAALAGHADTQMLLVAGASISVLLDLSKWWSVAWDTAHQTLPYFVASFWAAFVGESVQTPAAFYVGPTGIVLLGVAGYLSRLRSAGKGDPLPKSEVLLRVTLLCMLIGVGVTVYLRFLYWYQFPDYTWRLQVFQGRFLHVALAPLGLLVAEGWSLLSTRGRFLVPSLVVTIGILAALDVASLATLAGHYSWQ